MMIAAGAGFLVILAPQEMQVVPDRRREVLGGLLAFRAVRVLQLVSRHPHRFCQLRA